MHTVVSNVSFLEQGKKSPEAGQSSVSHLVNLLRIILRRGHARDIVENHLHEGVTPIRRRLASAALIKAALVSAVRRNMNLLSKLQSQATTAVQ